MGPSVQMIPTEEEHRVDKVVGETNIDRPSKRSLRLDPIMERFDLAHVLRPAVYPRKSYCSAPVSRNIP